LPFIFLFGPGDIAGINLFFIVGIGIVTALAYFFKITALERLQATIHSIISSIFEPGTAILISVLIGEALSLRLLIGGFFLILAAVSVELFVKNK